MTALLENLTLEDIRAERERRQRYKPPGPKQQAILDAAARFLGVEGAFRSAKTWTCLAKIRKQLDAFPGIPWAITRWTEEGVNQKLVPDWRLVCALMGKSHGTWNAREECFDFPNGSRVYAVHLKSSQKETRFAKVRGLTVAGLYVNQAEEVPQDVLEEAKLRISKPGFPQQFIYDANPVPDTHYLARMWPVDNRHEDHQLIQLSIWDNAHVLEPQTIAAAEKLYPEGHPARRTKLEGRRGLDVRGTPVYTGAFSRLRHVAAETIAVNPSLPFHEAYDYGFHHPAVVFYQWAPWGWVRVLGGIMAEDMHLDEFLPHVRRVRQRWFGDVDWIDACCDPAGANENSQGLRGTPVGVLKEWYRKHGHVSVTLRYLPDANSPERRRGAIDTGATYMRHDVQGEPCFQVDPERWIYLFKDETGALEERFDTMFLDALELGYVLEEEPRHSSRLGSFYVPKKDGWFEHLMNCFEYGLQLHVKELPDPAHMTDAKVRQHLAEVEAVARETRKAALAERQADPDDDPWNDAVDGTVPATPPRAADNRAGY